MLFRSNDTATTEIYTDYFTLSLHDALPISHLCAAAKTDPMFQASGSGMAAIAELISNSDAAAISAHFVLRFMYRCFVRKNSMPPPEPNAPTVDNADWYKQGAGDQKSP